MAEQVNGQTEREMWEEQQFLNGLRQIKDIKTNIALEMGDAKEVYDRIKKAGGFTKSDVKWAIELEEKDAAEVIATMQRRIRIAKMLGHGVARQVEMFEDRVPIEERAYQEGLAAGKLRKDMTNPYGLESPAGQAYQRGINDGTEFINKELAGQFEEGDGSELIKGDAGDDEPGFDADEAA